MEHILFLVQIPMNSVHRMELKNFLYITSKKSCFSEIFLNYYKPTGFPFKTKNFIIIKAIRNPYALLVLPLKDKYLNAILVVSLKKQLLVIGISSQFPIWTSSRNYRQAT